MASQTPRQRLALAICDFLQTSTQDGTLPSAEDADSIEVAINCIAESFKVDPSSSSPQSQNLLSIYSVYENLKKSSSTSSSTTDNNTTSSSSTTAQPQQQQQPSPDQIKQADSLKSQGNAAMARKDYLSAISLYTQALALHPSNAIYLSNRAAAHSAAKDHASARTDADAAVALDPSYTKAWSRLGLARFALGDAKGAMEAYQKGIEHEGNGGSEAMKKGYETAKRRVDELEADGLAESSARASPGGGAGGLPDLSSLASMFGGGGGGGMPDLSSIMSNPMFANMAQSLMSNPDTLNTLVNNPRLREMANQFSSGGGMPDVGSLMSDPDIANMARSMMGGQGSGNPDAGSGNPPGAASQ